VEACAWDFEDCDCFPDCATPLLANMQCDVPCNNEACGFDNGLCVGVQLDVLAISDRKGTLKGHGEDY